MSAPELTPPPVLPFRSTTAHHRTGWPEGYWRTVLWRGLRLRCPVCGAGGTLVSSFGPGADPELADHLVMLDERFRRG